MKVDLGSIGLRNKLLHSLAQGDEQIAHLHNGSASLEALQNMERPFSDDHRAVLVEVLTEQYGATNEQIDRLANGASTVTTGHQLCLFGGPLFFVIKILQTVKMAKALGQVPVFWLASEDHDFEEISTFQVYRSTLKWEREFGEAVGRMSTDGLESVYESFGEVLGAKGEASYLLKLFSDAYLQGHSLAKATRIFAHELLGRDFVVLDADDARLKRIFIPVMKADILDQSIYPALKKNTDELAEIHKAQIYPRPINFFYLGKQRSRIEKTDRGFTTVNGEEAWSISEMEAEIENNPERFSPNVCLRPMYQEMILPNLCYIGGGAEITYWMQLKGAFDQFEVSFPKLCFRNSVIFHQAKALKQLEAMGFTFEELFKSEKEITDLVLERMSVETANFAEVKLLLLAQRDALMEQAEKLDQSLVGAVGGFIAGTDKGLAKLEQKFNRSLKGKNEQHINKVLKQKANIQPNGALQERVQSIATYYDQYGKEAVDAIYEAIDPFDSSSLAVVLK